MTGVRALRALVLAVAVLWAPLGAVAQAHPEAPQPIEPPAWFTPSFLDLPDEVAAAKQERKRLMLYFGQDGCPYCRQLMDVNFSQKAIVDKTREHFRAIAFNIWGDLEVTTVDGRRMTEKQFARHLGVQFTPTLLFLDEQGGVALRMNGYYPPHEFDAALDYVAGRMEKKIAFADYLKSKSKPAARATLNPASFFLAAPYDLRRTPGGKPLAVLFETSQCAQCDEMHSVAFKRQGVLAELAKFDVVRLSFSKAEALTALDGSKTDSAAWGKALGVGYVPAIVLFDASGREAFRTEAYLRPFHLAGALEYVSSGAYKREPSFQRFLQSKADDMRDRGERVDLWN